MVISSKLGHKFPSSLLGQNPSVPPHWKVWKTSWPPHIWYREPSFCFRKIYINKMQYYNTYTIQCKDWNHINIWCSKIMNILLISIPSWPHHIWYQEPSFSFFSEINIENFTFLQICNPFKYSTKSSLNKQSTLSNRLRQDNIVQCGLYFYMNSFWGQLRKHLYELFNANASIQTLHRNFLFLLQM